MLKLQNGAKDLFLPRNVLLKNNELVIAESEDNLHSHCQSLCIVIQSNWFRVDPGGRTPFDIRYLLATLSIIIL